MIWGLTLEPGKVYTEIVQDELQLSMAILECRKDCSEDETNFSHIVMKTYNTEYLLCTLVKGAQYQQTLDLKIMPREKVTFSVQGSRTVYLVGYTSLCPDVLHDYDMGVDQDVPDWEEEYPEEESEEHYTVQPQSVADDLDLEDSDITQCQADDNRFQETSNVEGDLRKSGKISQEAELVYTVPEVVKEEPSSPHTNLGNRLAPTGSLQSHEEPTMSGTEHSQHDGTSFESYSPDDNHPTASDWSMQSAVGPPSQNDPLFSPGQSATNLGQNISSEGSSIYPVGVVGPSQPPVTFQNFQQSQNKRQRIESVHIYPPTRQTLNNSNRSQFPVHTGRGGTGSSQGPPTLGRGTLGSPSLGAVGPRSAAGKQSLKSIIPRTGSVNKKTIPGTPATTSRKSQGRKQIDPTGKTYLKLHTCAICNRSFHWYGAYTRHLMVHTGLKPYKCQFCDSKFSRRDNLTRHLKGHNKNT